MDKVGENARRAADLVGNLGRRSACLCRAGTEDLRGAGDLPTRARAEIWSFDGAAQVIGGASATLPTAGVHVSGSEEGSMWDDDG